MTTLVVSCGLSTIVVCLWCVLDARHEGWAMAGLWHAGLRLDAASIGL
jgi:hypothetical protein